VIQVDSGHNVRDLGGLPTVDGRTTAYGKLVRAEFTAAPELADRLRLRTVVDLRRPRETEHESVAWAEHGVRWINLPFGLGKASAVAGAGADFPSVYLGYLEHNPKTVIEAAAILMEPDNLPAMFHCAAGKDRTGVLSALLLDVLGVERAAIADDYALSGPAVEPILARLSQLPPYETMLASYDVAAHMPDRAAILEFLTRLGGTTDWLTANGLDPALIERFRAALLSDER